MARPSLLIQQANVMKYLIAARLYRRGRDGRYRPPRTDPCLRRYRTRFLLWICHPRVTGVETRVGKFMNNLWIG
jgi:hypothetical protein